MQPRRPGDPPRRPNQPKSLKPVPGLKRPGERFFKSKEYDTAFEIYQKALKLAPPGDSRALGQLCRCYRKRARKPFKKEQFKTVAKMLEEMLALDQVTPHLKGMDYKILAECYLELGKLKKADAAIDQALRLKPELEYDLMGLEKRLKTELLNQEMNGLH